MYIFISIIASICLGLMIYMDHVLFSKVSIKLSYLIKSVLFVGFALIFVATKNTFDKLLDFTEIEWLYFIVIALLGLGMFIIYNLSAKKEKGARNALFHVSSLLLFIDILFLIFSINTILKKNSKMNLVLLIVEMVLLVIVILISLLFLDKENKKLNILFSIGLPLGMSIIQVLRSTVIKNKPLIRQPLEVFIFWIAILCLIFSIIYFFISKEGKDKKKSKTPWQSYILILIPSILGIVSFSMVVGVFSNYKNVLTYVVNMIMGLSFIVPVIIQMIEEQIKTKKFIVVLQNNLVLILNSILLILSLLFYNFAISL